MAVYRTDPVGYFRDILGITLWDKFADIARACVQPPYKVAVQGGHNIGKSHFAGGLTNWFFDTHTPGIVVTTAPTFQSVVDLLWKEVRLQRLKNPRLPPAFTGPRMPELRSAEDHYAKGYTASKGEAFQGRHVENMMFLFDEAVGMDLVYFTTTKTMFKPRPGHCWLLFYNPTDPASPCCQEVTKPGSDWKVFSLSSLEHPNIQDEANGLPPRISAAVTTSQIDAWVIDWCDPVRPGDEQPTDIQWFIAGAFTCWWRPGPEFESRVLGKWPTYGSYSVWSEFIWNHVSFRGDGDRDIRNIPLHLLLAPFLSGLPEIGCDVGTGAPDKTEVHVRWGDFSLRHESFSIPDTMVQVQELCDMAQWCANLANTTRLAENNHRPAADPFEISMKIDDANVGRGIVDRLGELGYNITGVNSANVARNQKRYPNKRSELWFSTVSRAKAGKMWFGLLEDRHLIELRRQLMSPTWKLEAGRRVVEPKDKTKEKLGRSPDSADAVNLAYYESGLEYAPEILPAAQSSGDFRSIGNTGGTGSISDRSGGRANDNENSGSVDGSSTRRRKLYGR